MKRHVILILILLPVLLAAEVGITFTFANQQVTQAAGNNYFEFDVMVHATVAGYGLGTGITLINYNAAAFGNWIGPHLGNNAITVTRGELIISPYPFAIYDLIINDNRINRIAITHHYLLESNFGKKVPTTPIQLIHAKIKILDISQPAILSFEHGDMQGEQFLDDNASWFSPVDADAVINETLPVELSSFTASLNAQNQVNVQWMTQSETGVLGFLIYRSSDPELAHAEMISPLIGATNSSHAQLYLYKDTELSSDGTYYYWLECSDLDGSSAFHGPIPLQYTAWDTQTVPAVKPIDGIHRIYPNPFNPATSIAYGLTQRSSVEISIYNARGQIVRHYPQLNKEAGNYQLQWDGHSDAGSPCASGVYIVKMRTALGGFSQKLLMSK